MASPVACTYLPLGFSLTPTGTSRAPGALRRAGTLARSPMDGRKDKEKASDGDMTAQEV
jgi:exocyst complex component 1